MSLRKNRELRGYSRRLQVRESCRGRQNRLSASKQQQSVDVHLTHQLKQQPLASKEHKKSRIHPVLGTLPVYQGMIQHRLGLHVELFQLHLVHNRVRRVAQSSWQSDTWYRVTTAVSASYAQREVFRVRIIQQNSTSWQIGFVQQLAFTALYDTNTRYI